MKKVCLFEINSKLYYLPLSEISEVSAFPSKLNKIPLSSENHLGIFMLRDEVVNVLKLEGDKFSTIIKCQSNAVAVNEVIGISNVSELGESITVNNKIYTLLDKSVFS